MSFDEGPFLQTAVICERVLTEADGTLSLIRIVDQIKQGAIGPQPPETMPMLLFPLCLVIRFVRGKATGDYDVVLKIEKPSGLVDESSTTKQRITFQGGAESAHNYIVNAQLGFSEAGLYWFHVYLADPYDKAQQLVTRMPMRVSYARTQTGSSPVPPP